MINNKQIKKTRTVQNLLSCEIMTGLPMSLDKIATIEEKLYLDEKNYIGYKYTFTFNPSKWSLAEAWNTGINQVRDKLKEKSQHQEIMLHISTVEAHQNYYPHLHGVVYFKHKVSYKMDDIAKKFGRVQWQLLTRESDILKIKKYAPSIMSRDWFTYITKDYQKYKEYFFIEGISLEI